MRMSTDLAGPSPQFEMLPSAGGGLTKSVGYALVFEIQSVSRTEPIVENSDRGGRCDFILLERAAMTAARHSIDSGDPT